MLIKIELIYTALISITNLINNEPDLIITDNNNNIINTYRIDQLKDTKYS